MSAEIGELCLFNVKDGYLEGLCRGLRSGFLTPDDYRRLGMADTLEDLRTALEDTDYGNFLQDEPSPLAAATISMKLKEKMTSELRFMRGEAGEPLGEFIEFIMKEKMIDNVIAIIQGTINKKPAQELIGRTDPLGWFPEMKAIAAMDLTSSHSELYRTVLIDTPVAPYFERYLQNTQSTDSEARSLAEVASIFTETDIEIMRNMLKKAWLEDFYSFVQKIGGTTREVMEHILKSEADFRVLTVTLNSINTNLGASSQLQDRNSLYPSIGYLYPEGMDRIRKAWNDQTVRTALDPFPKYAYLYDQCKEFYMREGDEIPGGRGFDDDDAANRNGPTGGSDDRKSPSANRNRVAATRYKSLEDLLYAEVVALCELAFEQQFHYGIFYAWVKLKEQEIRNIMWIADMVLMKRKDQMDQIVPIFAPRY